MRSSDWSSDVCSSDLILFAETKTGFGLRQLGFVDGIVEADEQIALLDALAFVEMDPGDAARYLRPDDDGFVGLQRAYRLQLACQRPRRDLRRLYGDGRRLACLSLGRRRAGTAVQQPIRGTDRP